VCLEVAEKAHSAAADVTAIALHQDETQPCCGISPAACCTTRLSGQDRVTADYCVVSSKAAGHEPWSPQYRAADLTRTFPASKLRWLLDNVEAPRPAQSSGHCAFGTANTFLLWRLHRRQRCTAPSQHASRRTDVNIHTSNWTKHIARTTGQSLPPAPRGHGLRRADFGTTDADVALATREIRVCGWPVISKSALHWPGLFQARWSRVLRQPARFWVMNTGDKRRSARSNQAA